MSSQPVSGISPQSTVRLVFSFQWHPSTSATRPGDEPICTGLVSQRLDSMASHVGHDSRPDKRTCRIVIGSESWNACRSVPPQGL